MTDEQRYLLLQKAIYEISNEPMKRGQTLGDWINSLGSDDEVIKAIKSDSKMMSMVISDTYQMDSHASGYTAILVEPNSKSAVVVCRGSSTAKDWGDNLRLAKVGEGSDGVSTKQQESVLGFYQEWYKRNGKEYKDIVAIGHSKGGNNANYMALMDDSIKKSFTVNAPGFSDEFVAKYKDKIKKNGLKIYNNNTENDIVGTIMNQIGNMKYYKQVKDTGFIDTHDVAGILNFKKYNSGEPFSTEEVQQSKEAKEINYFINSFIRNTPPALKNTVIETIANIVDTCNIDNIGDLLKILVFSLSNSVKATAGVMAMSVAAYIIDFTSKYIITHPEFEQAIQHISVERAKGDANTVNGIIGSLKWGWQVLKGIIQPLTVLFAFNNININSKEEDLNINYEPANNYLSVYVSRIMLNKYALKSNINLLKSSNEFLKVISNKINFTAFEYDQRFNNTYTNRISSLSEQIRNLSKRMDNMQDTLSQVLNNYSNVETAISNNLYIKLQ